MTARERYDAIIIGSGFGGSMAAWILVHSGLRVRMIERGGWLARGPHNWKPAGAVDLTPEYSLEAPYAVSGERSTQAASMYCVGGPSVFYGGVSLRLREHDFAVDPQLEAGSGGRWPFGYDELEPYYTRAERILGVAGDPGPRGEGDGVSPDPVGPRRSGPYPHALPPLSGASRLVHDAARSIGLQPFRLPLAINYHAGNGRAACTRCLTCDAFACAVGAKNDLATAVLPDLIARGLRLETNTVAVRLVERRGRIESVECVDRRTGEARSFEADTFVLSAGALGSPHLLLASGLPALNPAGWVVGHFLMRHCNGIVYGLFPEPPNPDGVFHKQIGIHDYYFGDAAGGRRTPRGKLGSVQQVHSPPLGLAAHFAPRLVHRPMPWLIERMTGLLVMAEDQARFENHVSLDAMRNDRFGMPALRIHHRYTRRDREARRALLGLGRRVLRAAGARLFYRHIIHTFSHAAGTVRMGEDPHTSALDHACRFRGVDNLLVLDGSFMPAASAVNPSLTISAQALRAADLLTGRSVDWTGNFDVIAPAGLVLGRARRMADEPSTA